MKQHCKFRRIAESELECEHCKARIASQGDSVIRLCAAPAPDPPERDPASLPCNRRGAVMRQVSADAIGCMHESVTEYACELHGHCTLDIKVRGVKACVACMDLPISGDIPVEPLAEMHSDWTFREDAPLVLHCVLSPQFDSIYSRFFLPSLLRLRDENICLRIHRIGAEGNGDFGTEEYVHALNQRCAIVVAELEKMPDGEVAVFADVDIAFLGRFSEQLLACMKGKDLAFANERTTATATEINFGFFAARKSAQVLEFFTAVRDQCRSDKHDQYACRDLLQTTSLLWCKLPQEFSNFGLRTTEAAHADLLYHATNTAPRDGKTSLQLKAESLEAVMSRRMTRELVVARYTEDQQWLKRISLPAVVYDKSPEDRLIDAVSLPNSGREADTYLRHILDHYDDLAAVTVFAQGDPFPHVRKMRTEILRECTGYVEFETMLFTAEFASTKHGFRLLDAWRKLFGRTKPPERITYACGAQFAVTRDRIRLRPREFYESALAVANWPLGPWIIERLWRHIFGTQYHPDIRPADGFVSIICAARNNAPYLREALQSAVNQTVSCEVVYVDDCSTDNSVEIAKSVADVKVLALAEHGGVCVARNAGLAHSTGEFLVHLDGDDIMPPDFVAEHLKCMYDDTPFVYGSSIAFGAEEYAWNVPEWFNADIWQRNIANTSSLYRREVLDAIGGWRDDCVTMWDWDVALRAMRLGVPCVSKAILQYRHHADSWSQQIGERRETCAQRMRIVRQLNARLAIGAVVSGRLKGLFPEWLSRTAIATRFMHLQHSPLLLLLDNSNDPEFRGRMETESAKYRSTFGEIRFVDFGENVPENDCPEARRDAVSRYMAFACNRMLKEMDGYDLAWFIEDDVLIPQAAGERLYQALTEGERMPHAVSGCYRNRHNTKTIVGGSMVDRLWIEPEDIPAETTPVDFVGTGCLMFWTQRTPRTFPSHVDGIPAHDWAWATELRGRGGLILMLPTVQCGHAFSETEIISAANRF